jgi:general secretion pathway protein C
MLQQIQPWLPRLLILVQWMFGLAIAYVIANTGLILMGGSGSESNSTAKASQVVNSTQSMPPAPSLNSLIQRDLFGQSDSIGTASASAPTTPTRLPLNLRAVFVSTDPGQSTAIISQRNNSGKLYSPGDMLPGGAKLASVEATRVILSRAGTREELAFKSDFKAKKGIQAATIAPQQAAQTSPAAPANPQSNALQQINAQLAQDPDETLEKMGVSRRSEGGYRIGSTANQPFLAQSGLQPGDVVLSINGRPLGDINVDRLALTNLANAGSVSVELLRNGQTLTIKTRIPKAIR